MVYKLLLWPEALAIIFVKIAIWICVTSQTYVVRENNYFLRLQV